MESMPNKITPLIRTAGCVNSVSTPRLTYSTTSELSTNRSSSSSTASGSGLQLPSKEKPTDINLGSGHGPVSGYRQIIDREPPPISVQKPEHDQEAPRPFQSGTLVIKIGASMKALNSTPKHSVDALTTQVHDCSGALLDSDSDQESLSSRYDLQSEHSSMHHGSKMTPASQQALPPPVDIESICLSLEKYDKPRRILRLSSGLSLAHISMHGCIDRVNLSPLRSLKYPFEIYVH